MATPPNPLALLDLEASPEALMAARAAALRKQAAQRPATAEEAGALGAIGPGAALSPSVALAEALRNRTPNTGAYELFSGDDEGAVRNRAEGVNLGLGRQRAAGNLGLLTGDRVLGGFGQAQLQGADRQEAMLADAGQFRAGQTLKQALDAEAAKRAQAKAASDAKTAAEKQRHDDEQRELDRKNRVQAAAVQAGDKALQAKLETETGLRKEFWSLPAVKEFADTETNYQTIQDVIGDNSGMGATTLVFSIMKMLDPGVSVMQGDVDLIRQSGGKAAQWANVYESVLKGNPLSDKVRSDIMRQAQTLYQNRLGTVNKLAGKYGILASEIGVNPGRVLLGIGGAGDNARETPQRTTPTSSMPAGPDGNPTLDAPLPPGTKSSTAPSKQTSGASPPPLDPTKTETRRVYSKDGKWMRIIYDDGTFGVGPSDKKAK